MFFINVSVVLSAILNLSAILRFYFLIHLFILSFTIFIFGKLYLQDQPAFYLFSFYFERNLHPI